MTQAKYYDSGSGTWKAILAGPAGPTGPTGPVGAGVASGGATGTFLTKVDATDYNTQWSATLPVANGGTGATTAADARTNLGVSAPGDAGIPYRMSAGTASPTLSSASPWSAGSTAITFPTSRFSATPVVTATSTNNAGVPMVAWTSGASSTGFTLRIAYYGASANSILTHWTAVQMTSSTGNG